MDRDHLRDIHDIAVREVGTLLDQTQQIKDLSLSNVPLVTTLPNPVYENQCCCQLWCRNAFCSDMIALASLVSSGVPFAVLTHPSRFAIRCTCTSTPIPAFLNFDSVNSLSAAMAYATE